MLNKAFRKKKWLRFFVTAFLMGTLTCGQLQSTLAINENKAVTEDADRTIWDTVVVEKAVPLSEVSLPKSEYGKLVWANPNHVPTGKEDCEVLLTPEKDKDISWMKGWDEKKQVVHAYITVRVEDFEKEAEDVSDSAEGNEDVDVELWESDENMSDDFPQEDAVIDEEAELDEDTDMDENVELDEGTDMDEDAELDEDTDMDEDAELDEDTSMDEDAEFDEDTDMDEDAEFDEDADEDIDSTPDEESKPNIDKVETIFDREGIAVDTRPEYADESLNDEERQVVAAQNHNCEGITIYGENLPWYVQFRVYDGQEYQFTNQDGAELFKAYEFQLWDTLNEQEYEVPEGEYVTIRMSVPTGYTYTVEHIVASGGRESINPTIDGNTLLFSTHSFSPFGIAGSVVLVGGDVLEENYTKPSPSPTPTPADKGNIPTQKPGTTSGQKPSQGSGNVGGNQSGSGNGSGSSSGNTSANGNGTNTGNQNVNHSNPNTGDNSPILLFVGIAAAALLLIVGGVLFLLLRKK